MPDAFFARNEAPFRGMIHPERAAAEYADVDAAAEALRRRRDGAAGEYELVHDLINNALYFKDAKKKATGKKKTEAAAEATEAAKVEAAASETVAMAAFEAAVDRNRKSSPTASCARARDGAVPRSVRRRDGGGAEPGTCEEVEAESRLRRGALSSSRALWPRTSNAASAGGGAADAAAERRRRARAPPRRRVAVLALPDAAVANDVDWEAVAADGAEHGGVADADDGRSALLANAGLMAPVKSAAVPRYDVFVRVAAFDAPAEGKSSFAQEVDDLHVMTTECTPRSLVMLDEIGRGTSTVEGAALSAALLEWLDTRRIGCLFATHLHEIFPLLDRRAAGPLASLRRVCLGVEPRVDGGVSFLYTLQDGACTFSHAMHAARAAGLPADLIARAEALIAGADDVGDEAADRGAGADGGGGGGARGRGGGGGDGGRRCGAVERGGGQLRELTADLGGDVTRVPPRCRPPPKLAGRSCLYVLNLPPKTHAAALRWRERRDRPPPGEHRKKHGADRVDCWLVEVLSKTAATRLEAIRPSRRVAPAACSTWRTGRWESE